MARAGLPARSGIALKHAHAEPVLRDRPALGFLEVHAENYMVDGGPLPRQLEAVRAAYPLSLHGVGLDLGGIAPPDAVHLGRLRSLVRRYEPAAFSEHLAWCGHGGVFFNDLLPLPYDGAALARVCAHVAAVQDALGLRMLLENPSTYVGFAGSEWDEAEFLREVVRRTGCGLLLDVTNAWVGCTNRGADVHAYLAALPLDSVGEIHLAGCALDTDAAGAPLRIDDHGSSVDPVVWSLYEAVIAQAGPVPTLIEWDNRVPPLAQLLGEAQRAQRLLAREEMPA